jgi:uncharacterized membrane protein
MWWKRAFTVSALAWAGAIPLAALAVARPGALSFVFAYSVYALGHVVCHQLPERSFHVGATPLPVCARCTGIYLGAAIAVAAPRVDVSRAMARLATPRAMLVAAAVPTAATLVFEWTTGVMPAHWVRAVAGAPLGAAVAWIIREVN